MLHCGLNLHFYLGIAPEQVVEDVNDSDVILLPIFSREVRYVVVINDIRELVFEEYLNELRLLDVRLLDNELSDDPFLFLGAQYGVDNRVRSFGLWDLPGHSIAICGVQHCAED